jgi:hypothetical protein
MQEHQDDLAQATKDNPEAASAISEALALQSLTAERCFYCGDPADMVCPDCEAKIERKNRETIAKETRQRETQRLSWFAGKIPEIYRTGDDLLTPRWSRELTSVWNPQDRAGVTFQGPSNTWKTRGATKLLEKAFLAGRVVDFRQAGDLRREINRLARAGNENQNDSTMLRELIASPVLLLDDLGNQAFTEAAEEFMLSLIEGRVGKNLPTLVTTQFPSDEFIAKFSNRRIATAIARRIGPEHNWMVNTATGAINQPTPPTPRHQ